MYYYYFKRWRCSLHFAAIAFRTDRPFLHFSAVVSTCFLQISIPSKWIPGYLIDLFDHSSIQCDCWHWFVCCSVVKSAPQCLCLVWTDEISGVVTPLGHAIQLLLHCFRCLLKVLSCFVYEPVIFPKLTVPVVFTYEWYLPTSGIYLRVVFTYGWYLPTGGIYLRILFTYGWYLPTGGIYLRVVFTYWWYLPTSGIYLRVVYIYGWYLPTGGIYLRVVFTYGCFYLRVVFTSERGERVGLLTRNQIEVINLSTMQLETYLRPTYSYKQTTGNN